MSDEDWYILANLELIDEKIRWLNAAGVPCYNVPMNGTNNNLTFPSTNVEQVMEHIGLGNIGYTLSSTNRDHVYVMDLKSSGNNIADLLKHINELHRFEKPDENFEAWDNLLPVFQSVYDTFGVTIIPDNPHGVPKAPCKGDDDTLYVHFFSTSSDNNRGITTRSSIYGIELIGGQKDAIMSMSSFHGDSIKDDNGDVIAEIVEGNLYILNDLPHTPGDNVTRIFERIISAYFAIKKKPESLISKIKMGFRKTVTSTARKQFINGCTSLIDINVEAMERTVEKCDRELNVCNQAIVNYSRERDLTLQKLEPLKTSRDKREEWADKEYDALCAIPHIKNVEMENTTLRLFTDNIQITYKDVTYNMGEYKIEIYTDGTNEGVRVFNLTKERNGLQHPHIQRNGHCCLGNISQGVAKLVSEYEYTVLAQLIVNYLQTYNPISEYGSIRMWR